MRILLVNSLFHPFGRGGAEASVLELARGLSAIGTTVAVATLAPTGSKGTKGLHEGLGAIRVFRWETLLVNPFLDIDANASLSKKILWHTLESFRVYARRFIRETILEFKPDIIHSNNIAGFGSYIFPELARYPWIHTLRDYYMVCPRTIKFRGGRRCVDLCLSCRMLTSTRRSVASKPNLLVGVSDFVLESHREDGVWREVPACVVVNKPQLAHVRSRFVNRIATIGFLGKLDQHKGAAVLMRAISLVRSRPIELVMAGPIASDFRKEYLSLVENKMIRYIGQVPVGNFLERVDFVVVPSQWDEPFGRVASEAAQYGLPVLASRRGGLPEAVRGGRMVELVDEVDEPSVWARAIDDSIERWTDFQTSGPDSSPRDPTESYYELYETLLRSSLHQSPNEEEL